MPPLTESKLRKPTFRTFLELIKCTILNTGFAKGLFTDPELAYQSYTQLDEEIGFVERLLEFLEKFTARKIPYTGTDILKSRNDFKEAHRILQDFSKYAHSGKSCADVLKTVKKIPFLGIVAVKPGKTQTVGLFKEETAEKTESAKKPTGPSPAEKELEKAQTELHRLEKEVENSKSEISKLQGEIAAAKTGVEETSNKLETVVKENAAATKDPMGIKKNIEAIKTTMDEKKGKISQLEEEITKTTSEIAAKETQCGSIEQTLGKEYDDLVNVNQKLKEEFMALENDVRLRESQATDRVQEMDAQIKAYQELKEKNAGLRKSIDEAKTNAEQENLRTEAGKKAKEAEELKEEIEKLRKLIEEAKEQAKREQEAKKVEESPQKAEEPAKKQEQEEKVKPEEPGKGGEVVIDKNAISKKPPVESTSVLEETIKEEIASMSMSPEKTPAETVPIRAETHKEEPKTPEKISPVEKSAAESEQKKEEAKKAEEEYEVPEDFEPESPEEKGKH